MPTLRPESGKRVIRVPPQWTPCVRPCKRPPRFFGADHARRVRHAGGIPGRRHGRHDQPTHLIDHTSRRVNLMVIDTHTLEILFASSTQRSLTVVDLNHPPAVAIIC